MYRMSKQYNLPNFALVKNISYFEFFKFADIMLLIGLYQYYCFLNHLMWYIHTLDLIIVSTDELVDTMDLIRLRHHARRRRSV